MLISVSFIWSVDLSRQRVCWKAKMGGIENNSSTIRLIENLKHEVKQGKKDCQNEAIVLFKEIFTAIDTHTDTPSVNKDLEDLALEVCGLEDKLSIIIKERDNLLDTVDKLRAEIWRLSAKLLPTMQPFQLSLVHIQGSQNVNSFDDGNVNTRGQGVKITRIPKRGGDQKKHSDYGETTTQIVQQQIQNSSNEPQDSDNYDYNEVEYADIKEIEHVASDGEASLTKDLNHAQKRVGHDNAKKNDNQDYDHTLKLKLNFQKTPANKKVNKKFKCDQCPYSATQKHHMKAHIEAVHDKIKNHRCEECGYASSRKDILERHWDAVHNKGDKKFKCGRCPYSFAQKAKLEKHIGRVHER